jgi:hypothetical protein
MMMSDLLLWTCVVGVTPLALALIRQAVAWSRDTVRAGRIARGMLRTSLRELGLSVRKSAEEDEHDAIVPG